MKQANTKALLAVILLIATLSRLWNIGYDLPYVYHPDEPRYIVISQNIFKTGDLNPHFFNYPSLFFYINSLAYIPYYLLGKLLQVFHTPNDILAPISLTMGVAQARMPTTVLLGRIVTVSFGVGVVLVTFLIGKQLTSKVAVGLLASLMTAISPTSVCNDRLITPDTFVTFFVLASFLAAVLILQQGRTWHYAIAGVCVGLSASSKYNGALIVLSLLSAHFLRYGKKGFKKRELYLALFLGSFAFLATTPFALLDFPQFITDLRFEARHYSTGHPGMEGDTLRWYLSYLWETTGPICLLAQLEVLRGIYSRSKQVALLSVFPLMYFMFISRFVVRNDRTLMPLTPFLFLLAASSLMYSLCQVNASESSTRKLMVMVLNGLTIISLVMPAFRMVKNTLQLAAITSRETAREWIADNLPSGAKVAIESYSPFVDPANFSVQGLGRMINHAPQWYIDNDFDYLVISQGMFGRFYQDPDRYRTEVSQYNDLFERFTLLKVFTDGGYEVRIYQVSKK